MKLRTYIYALLITLILVFSGFYFVNIITENKLKSLRNIETDIAINILSLETQFSLLQELSCKDISKSILSSELDALADKLNYMEATLPKDDSELNKLKRYYSLLEIKDFILMQKINNKCQADMHFIIYFYSNTGDCDKCKKQGRDITRLIQNRENLRVYNFDYNISLSAIETLKKIYSVEGQLPILIIDGKTYYGGVSYDELVNIIPNNITKNNDEEK